MMFADDGGGGKVAKKFFCLEEEVLRETGTARCKRAHNGLTDAANIICALTYIKVLCNGSELF